MVVSQEEKEEFGPIRTLYNEMSEEVTEVAMMVILEALKDMKKGKCELFKDVAKAIKTEFEAKYPGSWHVICGRDFGSHVTHEVRNILFCSMGRINLLIFKHG
ncbi:dynein light chain-like protein [Aureococcus anophagefferens]|uniref:Dynein light chain n=2 Tax=Aureococcus anophagefferens TaxID=44056 RepID=A0ABR1FVV2_AURAN|nr:hypothetical protein JL722_13563 [Aureococcus anophagefferens]KAH8047345.1 hypothetical protein JL722_13159 [Aureococcus anophagefferens]KAH8071625.1 hypothetical protein JL721_4125 [Aureococcus anophagefferens]